MFNTLFSVPDIASSARCHTKLAVAGMGVVDDGGVWAGGEENSQRCMYMRGSVVYVHILCTYKQVMRQCKKTANTQMAHLVFADTRAKTQKTKRAIFLPTHR